MIVEVPDYNTQVDFPDTMTMDQIKPILQKKFPAPSPSMSVEPPKDVISQEAEKFANPWMASNVKALPKMEPIEKDKQLAEWSSRMPVDTALVAGTNKPKTFTEKLMSALDTFSKATAPYFSAQTGGGFIPSDTATADETLKSGQAMGEAAWHTARGMVAWPLAKIFGLVANIEYGAKTAREIESELSGLITGTPKSEAGKDMFEATGQIMSVPFIPAQKLGEWTQEHVNPRLGYFVGSAGEVATMLATGKATKELPRMVEVYKAVRDGKMTPRLQNVYESMPVETRRELVNVVDTIKEGHPIEAVEGLKKVGIPEGIAQRVVESISDAEIVKPEKKPSSTITPDDVLEGDTINAIDKDENIVQGPKNTIEPTLYEKTIETVANDVNSEVSRDIQAQQRGSFSIEKKPDYNKFSFEDQKIEEAYKRAQGVPKQPFIDRVKDVISSIHKDITRTYKEVPNEPEFAQFVFDMKKLEKGYSKAAYETISGIRGETHKFDPYQMDIFSRKVLLDDMKYTLQKGKQAPFGFTEKTVYSELSRIDAEIMKHPEIQKSLERRKQMQDALVDTYVDLRKYFGDDVSALFKNENYYRNQVLEYAQLKGMAGTGDRLSVPTQRGFLKTRQGSGKDINTNYLEAEYEYRSQMIYDIEIMRALKSVDEHYNIIEDIKNDAKAQGLDDWHDAIPSTHTAWQPIEGNLFYTADSIPAKLAEQLRNGILDEVGITLADLRQALAIATKRRELVVPNEIAKTLDHIGESIPENAISRFSKNILTAWKVWTLVSPRRLFKYNVRNMTGDADAVFIGNPKSFRVVPKATKELFDVIMRDKAMTGEVKEWFDRGGMESNLQVQEIGDINSLTVFDNLVEKHGGISHIPGEAWNKYWKSARMTTDFREAILRYANYKEYLNQINKNHGRPDNYGASDPGKIDALTDYRDKAYELSNDLLGAYDRISVAGQYIRGHLFPFWSWKEVNFRRYVQFAKNAANDAGIASLIGRKAMSSLVKSPYTAYRLGSFIMKASALWGILQSWNYMMFPDEEKELPRDITGGPHIVLGRDDNGKILYFNRLGSTGDFMSWFGLDGSVKYAENFLNGKMTLQEIALDMAKSPVNVIAQGINPFVKTPTELLMRQSLFPDVFHPMLIRDRGLHLARSLGLENEYKSVAGIPSEGYTESLSSIFLYKSDPKQAAYSEMYDQKKKFLEKLNKSFDGWMLTPRGQALYNIKLAIRYGDEDALVKSLVQYKTLGGTSRGLKQSIKAMHPLWGMNHKEQQAFISTLNEEDKGKLVMAVDFYNTTLKGKGKNE